MDWDGCKRWSTYASFFAWCVDEMNLSVYLLLTVRVRVRCGYGMWWVEGCVYEYKDVSLGMID